MSDTKPYPTPNELADLATYVTCKECSRELKRYKGGVFPNGKDTKYVDENRRQWSGRTCPDCHIKNNAVRQKNNRKVRKLYV